VPYWFGHIFPGSRLLSTYFGIRARHCVAALASSCASLTVAAQGLPIEVQVDGPPAAIAVKDPSRPVIARFNARAGQRIGLGVSDLRFAPPSASSIAIRIRAPAAAAPGEVVFCHARKAEGRCGINFTAATSGEHLIELQGPFSAAASLELLLSTPVTRPLAGDKPASVSIARVGQDARFELDVRPGDDLSVALGDLVTGARPAEFALRVLRPDGSLVGESVARTGLSTSVALGSAAPPGRYQVEVDPRDGATGTFSVAVRSTTLLTGPADVVAGTPGAEVRFSFRGSAGRTYGIGIEDLRHTPDVENYTMISLMSPDGTRFAFKGCGKINGRMDACRFTPKKLPVDGVYTLVLRPPHDAAVSGRLQVMEDMVVEEGPPVATRMEIARPGQVLRVQVTGKAGERLGVVLTGIKHDPRPAGAVVATFQLQRPDGGPMGMPMWLWQGKDRVEIGPVALPATGTYTLLVDPLFGTLSADLSWVN
jgi:hypothetical protein